MEYGLHLNTQQMVNDIWYNANIFIKTVWPLMAPAFGIVTGGAVLASIFRRRR